MSRRDERARATWVRLGPEARAQALDAYRRGATAAAVGARFGVSPSTVYRWASEAEGCSKRRDGDAIAAERAAVADGAAAQAADAGEAEGRLELGPDAEAGDPDALGRAALAASAGALKRGRARDALELARLAEGYFRLADRGRRVGDAPDLDLILRALRDGHTRTELFRIHPDDPRPPLAKLRYWGWKEWRGVPVPDG